MKHILIIEGFRPAHECLKSLGAEITMIIEEYRLSGNEDELYNRVVSVSKDAGYQEWIDAALRVDKISKIDAVINFHENRQLETLKICETLGIPYHNKTAILAAKDKIYMRKILNQLELDKIKNIEIKNKDQLIEQQKIKPPYIIKPYNGWASKNIFFIKDEREIFEIADKIFDNKTYDKYCLEEFIDGEEYSVEAFSEFGIHKIISVTQKYKNENFVEIGHCLPAKIEIDIYNKINNFIINILDGLGIRNGATHSEIIVNNIGEVNLVETHLRLGGDNIPELIRYTTGIDILNLWCRNVIGEKVLKNIPVLRAHECNKFSSIYYIISDNNIEGKRVKQIIGIDKVKNSSKICEIKMFIGEGETINTTNDSFSRLGYVIAIGDTYEEAINNAKQGCSEIKICAE